jgi:hypothetical protein
LRKRAARRPHENRGRGFSGRDMPHNAEGGPDRSTNSEVCGVTMTGARAQCGFPRRQRRLGSGIVLGFDAALAGA